MLARGRLMSGHVNPQGGWSGFNRRGGCKADRTKLPACSPFTPALAAQQRAFRPLTSHDYLRVRCHASRENVHGT